jgi:hypothetical protein
MISQVPLKINANLQEFRTSRPMVVLETRQTYSELNSKVISSGFHITYVEHDTSLLSTSLLYAEVLHVLKVPNTQTNRTRLGMKGSTMLILKKYSDFFTIASLGILH